MTDRGKSVLRLDPKNIFETENDLKPPQPRPSDLPAFLPYACAQLGLSFDLKVHVVIEEEYVAKAGTGDVKKKKSTFNLKKIQSKFHQSELNITPARSSSRMTEEESDNGGMHLHLKCVVAGTTRATVALILDRNSILPRELLSLLRLCATYNPQLTRFSARWCKLEPGALYELVALLPLGNINDVRLDDTTAQADDCQALLDTGRLQCLSVARCQLGDEGCSAVAEALIFPRPASLTLVALILAGNAIGDAGAHAMARALRSNRTLRLLDLADNQLRDEGGLAILHTFAEFPLTLDEILIGRQFRIECTLMQCRQSWPLVQPRASREGPTPFDPFPAEDTVQRGGHMYSRGNSTLNCLNLAYNSLSMVSLRALLHALQAQATGLGCEGGLMRVQLDGNPLPACAPEYEAVAVLLERALIALESANKHQIKKKRTLSKKLLALHKV